MCNKRLLAGLICVVLLALCLAPASAATYPYETTSADSVKLRKAASTSAVVLANIPAGGAITVLGKSGKFYKVQYGGFTGYAMREYVDGPAETGAVSTLAPASAVTGYPYDTTAAARVKLREKAAEDATVIVVIPQGAAITVQDVTANGFAKVKYSGKVGYAMTAYLNLAAIPTPTPVPTSAADASLALYTSLKNGATGSAVRALQEALTELGFYEGTVDSTFGAQTRKSVAAFQKKNKLDDTGVADAETQVLLYEGKPRNAKNVRQAVKTVAPVEGAVISSGKKGEAVEKLQTRLKELGYYVDEITGTCDANTVSAIKAFQSKCGLTASGKADSATQALLYSASALGVTLTVTPTPAATLQIPAGSLRKGDSGDEVMQVQYRLKELGYFKGTADGKYGDATVKAVKTFQQKNKLTADGVCGAVTLSVMFADHPVYAVATPAPAATTPPATATMAPITEENAVIITAGTTGTAVYYLQQRLQELGYYTSRLDGVYLEDDITAVRAFQKANGLTVDGKAGYQTQTKLYGTSAVAASGASSGALGATLRYGDTGASVSTLQTRLIELGYLTGAADGRFGASTKTAVVAFQKASGLTGDGVVGASTQNALFSASAVANSTAGQTTNLTMGVISAAVKDLQTRLLELGYLTGKADGVFGATTRLALIAIQTRTGLTADGIAGAKTLAKLNSGSATSASGTTPTPTVAPAPTLSSAPRASDVRYANWYAEVKAMCKKYPNATVYDFTTGISWQVNMFSFGAHADSEPLTAEDTAKMNQAFGGVTTWTPKAVWVVLSNGSVYMASTHNTPHETSHIRINNFNGHLCIHFPRTEAQVTAIGPYATQHQKAIDLGWAATQKRIQ